MPTELTTCKNRLDVERSRSVIEALGGTVKVAEHVGLRPQSVSNWKRFGIPEGRLLLIQSLFKKVPAVRSTLDFQPWKCR